MLITRIFATPDGVSHFEDLPVPLRDAGSIGHLSSPADVQHVIFRETSADYDYDWHTAPARQYIVLLDGRIEIEVGDGTVRQFQGGDVLLVDDINGRGHRTRALNGKQRRSLFITLREQQTPEDAAETSDEVQEAGEGSFPASDPPSWTGTAAT